MPLANIDSPKSYAWREPRSMDGISNCWRRKEAVMKACDWITKRVTGTHKATDGITKPFPGSVRPVCDRCATVCDRVRPDQNVRLGEGARLLGCYHTLQPISNTQNRPPANTRIPKSEARREPWYIDGISKRWLGKEAVMKACDWISKRVTGITGV